MCIIIMYRVRSTNFNRCIQTLKCVLAGIFGATNLTEKGQMY